MIRQCTVSTTDVQAVQRSDGSWTVEGVEAEHFLDTVLLLERAAKPFNSTFYLTLNSNECLQRIINNESDFSNLFIPLHADSPYYHAPQTIFPGKNQFLAGYVISETNNTDKDTATVFTNVELLEPAIYMWSLIFLASIFTFVSFRVSIHMKIRIDTLSALLLLIRSILRQISGILYRSNNHFRLMTIIYSLFCFYMITTFLCIYKTSHVIAERPFYPKSYQESLDYKTSLVSFYDQFVVVSRDFKSASPDSTRKKLWNKLIKSGLYAKYSIDPQTTTPTEFPTLMLRFILAIVEEKFIAVASSITMPLLKSLGCGFSPENQLWFIKIFSDSSEREIIYGYVTGKNFIGAKNLAKKLRSAFEFGIVRHHYDLALEVTFVANRLSGTTKAHQWRQNLACNHEEALIADVEVHPVSLPYFHSFFVTCALVWTTAFIIHLKQIVYAKRMNRLRSNV